MPQQLKTFSIRRRSVHSGERTAAILALTVTIRKVFNINRLYVPFGLAIVLSFALAFSQDTLKGPLAWFIVLVNACLLFLAVVGANETTDNVAKPKAAGGGEQQGGPRRKLIQSFFD
jgi:hypothetical protein